MTTTTAPNAQAWLAKEATSLGPLVVRLDDGRIGKAIIVGHQVGILDETRPPTACAERSASVSTSRRCAQAVPDDNARWLVSTGAPPGQVAPAEAATRSGR